MDRQNERDLGFEAVCQPAHSVHVNSERFVWLEHDSEPAFTQGRPGVDVTDPAPELGPLMAPAEQISVTASAQPHEEQQNVAEAKHDPRRGKARLKKKTRQDAASSSWNDPVSHPSVAPYRKYLADARNALHRQQQKRSRKQAASERAAKKKPKSRAKAKSTSMGIPQTESGTNDQGNLLSRQRKAETVSAGAKNLGRGGSCRAGFKSIASPQKGRLTDHERSHANEGEGRGGGSEPSREISVISSAASQGTAVAAKEVTSDACVLKNDLACPAALERRERRWRILFGRHG